MRTIEKNSLFDRIENELIKWNKLNVENIGKIVAMEHIVLLEQIFK